jgi:hypothetical protein
VVHIWRIFVISVFLLCYGISGQASEVCSHDCSKYEFLNDSSSSQFAQKSDLQDSSSTDDCGTASHTHSCCSHFSVLVAKPMGAIAKTFVNNNQLSAYISEMIPAPYLDGPFQPPRI